MVTIFDEVINKVSDGYSFHVDLEKRNLEVGHKMLIKEGVVKNERQLGIKPTTRSDALKVIQTLYDEYRVSYPTERNSKKRKRYFACLSCDELTTKQMVEGQNRDVAQVKLEMYLLMCILNGFEWSDDLGNWFWKGNNGLVIFKQWVKGEN